MNTTVYIIPLRRMLFPEMPVTYVTVTANDAISAIFHAEENFPDCYFDQNRDSPAKRPLRVNYPASPYPLPAMSLALLQARRQVRFGMNAAVRSSLGIPFHTVELKNDAAGRQWIEEHTRSVPYLAPGLDEEVTVEEQPANPEPEKPKPCPYCRSTRTEVVDTLRGAYVRCLQCGTTGAEANFINYPDCRDQAVRAWNKVKR